MKTMTDPRLASDGKRILIRITDTTADGANTTAEGPVAKEVGPVRRKLGPDRRRTGTERAASDGRPQRDAIRWCW